MKEVWDSLDLTDIQLPTIPAVYLPETEDLCSFIDTKLEDSNNLPRCDYKEMLELAKLFLGGCITRKKSFSYQLSRPGADHHARWMSKSIYVLKMVLLQHQLHSIHWQTKKKLEKMALFIVFCYLRSWFDAPLIPAAAANDLLMYRRLEKFKKIHRAVSRKTCTVLNRHTWYLTI